MWHPRGPRGIVAVATLLVVGGCGDATGGRQTISGTVTLKGIPLDEGFIEFHPIDAGSPKDLVTKTGAMIQSGQYHVAKAKGLVPGKYRVLISSGDKKAPLSEAEAGGPGPKNIFSKERIPPEYNVKTKQVIEVTKEGPNRFDWLIP